MILMLFLLCTIFYILYSWITIIKDGKSVKFPGPFPWPVLGNGHLFFGNSQKFLRVLTELSTTYGGACRFHICSNRYIIFSDPEYIQAITTNSEFNNKGETYKFLFPWLGLGLLTANESTMGVSFNAQLDSESEYIKSIEKISKIVALRMRNGLLAEDAIFNLTSHKKVHDEALKVLHYQSRKAIETRKKALKHINSEVKTNTEEGVNDKHAFLDSLLLAKVDDENIREEVDTFMFEGHDTTASGIAFCLYCLSKHSDIQDKVLSEQMNILGDDLDKEPTYQEIQQMKYLDLVIKESLRIFPSVPLIERTTTKDTEIAGRFIPKGTTLLIDIMNMQRSAKYFVDPLEFRPERFADNLKNSFSWLAFSAGPRNCIGQKFAILEMKVTISAVIKKFVLLPSETELKLGSDLILKSINGVPVKLKPRVQVD